MKTPASQADAISPAYSDPRETGDDVARATPRRAYLRPRFILLVALGGMFGALARYGLTLVVPAPTVWLIPTLSINLSAAFLLGLVLEALIRRGPDTGRRRAIRLGIGTGFLGALSTYSTLAFEAVELGTSSEFPAALMYTGVSLGGGVLASTAGIWAASKHHKRIPSKRTRAWNAGKDHQ